MDALDRLLEYLMRHGTDFNTVTLNALIRELKRQTTDGITTRRLTGIQVWASRRTRLQNILEVYNTLTESEQYGDQLIHGNLLRALLTSSTEDVTTFWHQVNRNTPKLF